MWLLARRPMCAPQADLARLRRRVWVRGSGPEPGGRRPAAAYAFGERPAGGGGGAGYRGPAHLVFGLIFHGRHRLKLPGRSQPWSERKPREVETASDRTDAPPRSVDESNGIRGGPWTGRLTDPPWSPRPAGMAGCFRAFSDPATPASRGSAWPSWLASVAPDVRAGWHSSAGRRGAP